MKIAIVTGASSGMGREAVLQIAERFPKLEEIWVVARRKERLEELQKEVSVPLRIFPLDLAMESAQNVLKEALEEAQPPPDLPERNRISDRGCPARFPVCLRPGRTHRCSNLPPRSGFPGNENASSRVFPGRRRTWKWHLLSIGCRAWIPPAR